MKAAFTSKIAYLIYITLCVVCILCVNYTLNVKRDEKRYELKQESQTDRLLPY